MIISELIERLKNFNPNMEVWIKDVEGNDYKLEKIEESDSPINSCNPDAKSYKIILLGD